MSRPDRPEPGPTGGDERIGRRRSWAAVQLAGSLALAVSACAGAGAGAEASPTARPCPPPTAPGDSLRSGTVLIDGRPVATAVPMRLEQLTPETYTIPGPEPDSLRALPVERIDLIQFLSGPDAERLYALCPGTVAMLVTTRR